MEDSGVQLQYYKSLLQRLSAIEGQNRVLEFELETHTSVIKLLEEACEKIGKQVFEKQQDLSALQQKHLHQLQNLKLHEEMQKGLNASVVNEANAYHALKADLHSTVNTHKQLISSRNKQTFEKRKQMTDILQQKGISGSASLCNFTDADAFAAGEHEYVALNKQIEAEIAAKCNAHPLLKALGNDSESRLRLAYSCFRDAQRLTDGGLISFEAISEFAEGRMNKVEERKSNSLEFLLSLVNFTLYTWKPSEAAKLQEEESALLKALAIKKTFLADRKWYTEPQAVLYGSGSLQHSGKEEGEKTGGRHTAEAINKK